MGDDYVSPGMGHSSCVNPTVTSAS